MLSLFSIDFRNLFVPDFARKFFAGCELIYVRYTLCILDVEHTLIKFACSQRKIGRKVRCRRDSESLFFRCDKISQTLERV